MLSLMSFSLLDFELQGIQCAHNIPAFLMTKVSYTIS